MARRAAAWLLLALVATPFLPLAQPASPAAPAVIAGPMGVTLDTQALSHAAEPALGMLPHPPGSVLRTTFLYGPHTIPPGWDFDRYALSLPFQTGFVTKLGFRLQEAATGETPTNLQVHIHHGLWFALEGDRQGQAFIFGTGEERTSVDLERVAAADPAGPLYGIPFTAGHPQFIILMLHNKQVQQHTVNILVDVDFVFGTQDQIEDARHCHDLRGSPLDDIDGCVAGKKMHGTVGALWGDVFDVPRQAQGSGVFTYPTDGQFNRYGPPDYGVPLPVPVPLPSGSLLSATYTAAQNGTLVFGQGHLHPNGVATIVANLGPAGSGCEADLDGDGLPGVTLFRSDKIDRDPDAWPYSEDYQMGVTKPGYRAPLRAGDRLAQLGLYANRDVATYNAMTFAALQIDAADAPAPRSARCTLDEYAPQVRGGGDPVATVPNRVWDGPLLPLCDVPGAPACEAPGASTQRGLEHPPAIAIAAFAYLTGDRNLASPLGDLPTVPRGASLTFQNLDTGALIRHTVTSCAWPCNGVYTANYPRPDGVFDSDRLGNLDLADGGSVPPDRHDDPTWDTPSDLPAGFYAYYCRIHPTMRGAFEVVP